MLFTHAGKLKCWSVFEDRLIWEYEGQQDFTCVREFVYEVVEGGQAAVVVVGVWVGHTACVLFAFPPRKVIEWRKR